MFWRHLDLHFSHPPHIFMISDIKISETEQHEASLSDLGWTVSWIENLICSWIFLCMNMKLTSLESQKKVTCECWNLNYFHIILYFTTCSSMEGTWYLLWVDLIAQHMPVQAVDNRQLKLILDTIGISKSKHQWTLKSR